MSQEWHDVLFFHYKFPKELIQTHCPFPLDLYNGEAVVSVVPFKMSHIKFSVLPSVRGLTSLWELNLRTYVEVNGIKGIYFFTLDTDSMIGKFIARFFFNLPYNYAKISAQITQDRYIFNHSRGKLNLQLEARLSTQEASDPFDIWATERYSLFTHNPKFIYQGIVQHRPWKLQRAELISLEDNFTNLLNIPTKGAAQGVSYSKKIKVHFSQFQKIGKRT